MIYNTKREALASIRIEFTPELQARHKVVKVTQPRIGWIRKLKTRKGQLK